MMMKLVLAARCGAMFKCRRSNDEVLATTHEQPVTELEFRPTTILPIRRTGEVVSHVKKLYLGPDGGMFAELRVPEPNLLEV